MYVTCAKHVHRMYRVMDRDQLLLIQLPVIPDDEKLRDVLCGGTGHVRAGPGI